MKVTSNATIENVRDLAEYDSKTARRILGATVKELRAKGVHVATIEESLNELGHPWSMKLKTADGATAWAVSITSSDWGKRTLYPQPDAADDDDEDSAGSSNSFL
jgi:hypothetical protein